MTTLTNDQITAGAAVLDLDLDELQALCDAVKRPWYGTLQIADGVTDDDAAKFIEAFSPDTVSELIAAVRHAPSPQIAEKVGLLPHEFKVAYQEHYIHPPEDNSPHADRCRLWWDKGIAASRRAEGGMSIEIKHAPAGKTDFARGEILGYERSPTRFMVVGEDDLYVHTFILGTGMYWGVRKEEQNLACLVRYSAAQPAEVSAGQAGQVSEEMVTAAMAVLDSNQLLDGSNCGSDQYKGVREAIKAAIAAQATERAAAQADLAAVSTEQAGDAPGEEN